MNTIRNWCKNREEYLKNTIEKLQSELDHRKVELIIIKKIQKLTGRKNGKERRIS